MYNAKVKNYQKEALKTRVAGANRYQIIQMLMMGALEKLVLAKVSIERKDLEAKSENIPDQFRWQQTSSRFQFCSTIFTRFRV